MQDSLPAGGLRLYREGVEPSGSLRKVSGYITILLSRTCPVARAELRKIPDFETYLRRALAGDRAGFRELVVYAQGRLNPRIMRALWKAGAPVRPHRATIKHEWKLQASLIVAAF